MGVCAVLVCNLPGGVVELDAGQPHQRAFTSRRKGVCVRAICGLRAAGAVLAVHQFWMSRQPGSDEPNPEFAAVLVRERQAGPECVP